MVQIVLTASLGKSHLRMRSGLALDELQVNLNSSPFLRITFSFCDRSIMGGLSGASKGGMEDEAPKEACCSSPQKGNNLVFRLFG